MQATTHQKRSTYILPSALTLAISQLMLTPAVAETNTANEDTPYAELETIVVTATKTDKTVINTPIPVKLIDDQALEDYQSRTLKEAIEELPGVTLREVHGKTGYQVMMQGMDSDKVLVLIDGLPVTASTNGVVNLNQYLNVEVEQVEVIQGASSAQYGSAAMGGVINVITKSLANNPNTDKAATGHVLVEAGTNGDQNPSGDDFDDNMKYAEASIEGRLDTAGHVVARLSGSYLQDDGLTTDTDEWDREKDAREQTQASVKVAYQPTAGSSADQVWAETTYYTEEDERRFTSRGTPRYGEESIDKQRFTIGFDNYIDSGRLQDGNLQGKLFYETYDSESDVYYAPASASTIYTDRDANMNTKLAQLQYDLPEWNINDNNTHLLQIGTQWQQDELEQTNSGVNEMSEDTVDRDVVEFYVQDDWLIGDNWEVLAGVRYQDDSDFGDHVAPKLAVKYNHITDNGNEHVWRASVGQGYRVPTLKDRYYAFDHSVYGYMVVGNPDLEPETSNSYQLGYQGEYNKDVILTANAFYNEIDDLIQTEYRGRENGVSVYTYDNVDSATTYGGDVGVSWQFAPKSTLQADYTYTKTKNGETDTELTGRPEHLASISWRQQVSPKMRVTNKLNYASKHLVDTDDETYSPSWWTWDTKLKYQLTPNLALHGGVENLFNQQRDFDDANDESPVDNRQWTVGASYDF